MENQRNSDEGSPKRKRLSLSLKRRREQNGGSPRKRFARTSEEEMESLKTKLTSKNTKRSQVWALNVFKEWVGNNRELEIEYDIYGAKLTRRRSAECYVGLLQRRNNAQVNHTVPSHFSSCIGSNCIAFVPMVVVLIAGLYFKYKPGLRFI